MKVEVKVKVNAKGPSGRLVNPFFLGVKVNLQGKGQSQGWRALRRAGQPCLPRGQSKGICKGQGQD